MSFTTARVAHGPNRLRAASIDERLSYIEDQAEGGAFGGGSGVRLAAGSQTAATGTVVFANSNGVTFGMSGSSQITASFSGGGGGISAINLSAGTVSNNLTNAVFSNANGVSFGLTGSTVTASHNGLTSQSAQAFSASGGSSAFQTLSFNNANGLTFSNVGGAIQASYTVPSTAGLLSAIRLSAGTTSNNLSAVTFDNGGGVTFGLNGSVITASAPAGGGGGGATLSNWPLQPWPWASSSVYTGATATTAGGARTTASMYISPFGLPAAVAFNMVRNVLFGSTTVAGTGSVTIRDLYGLYTRTASTLSLVSSWAANAVVSQSSVTAQTMSWWAGSFGNSTGGTSRVSGNVSASLTGYRALPLGFSSASSSLSAGQYFIGHVYLERSSSSRIRAMDRAWRYSVSQFTGAPIGFSNTTGPLYCECNGIASTTQTGAFNEFVMPGSVHITAITATGGTSRNQWPLLAFASVTA